MTDHEATNDGAVFSPDRLFRYKLWRCWDYGPSLIVIGCNPSVADETSDDPTIRRCIGYAKREGLAGLVMLNVHPYRATDPRDLQRYERSVIGQSAPITINAEHIRHTIRDSQIVWGQSYVLAAWGNHGEKYAERTNQELVALGVGVACLGMTRRGQPRHPLYMRADAPFGAWIFGGGPLVKGVEI